MASKVRVKLAKQAADPKSSLRLLVLQANMLDRLMDDITVKSQKPKPKQPSTVTFSLPQKKEMQSIERSIGPNVTEYEVDSDSDSDSDDEDYAYTSSDSEENVFDPEEDEYLSDSDDDEIYMKNKLLLSKSKSVAEFDLSENRQLLIVFERDEEEVPELQNLNSTSSDSDSEEELSMPSYIVSPATSPYLAGLTKQNSHNVSVEDISFQPQHVSAPLSIENVY